MTILVTGATGNVGGNVVRTLLAHGAPVRAFVRDAGGAERMFGPDVELAVGDFTDRASIERALSGADRLFLACGNVPGQVEYECALIDAAAAAGVARVVKLSGPAAAADSPLIFERWHAEIERHLAGSGLPRVVLRPRTYLSNLMAYASTVARTGMLFAPAGTAAISFVDPRDVSAVAAETLIGDGHEGRTYTLTGPEAVTFAHIAEAMTAATGRPVSHVDVSDDDARRAMIADGLPPMVADAIVAIFVSQRAGSMADTTDTVRRILGREPRTVEDFTREYADAFRPADREALATPS
jgi:uncharacterized protein YbjT (DUF2867 family)